MSNKKVTPNGRQAFTLIEILLIVAIIALLATVVLVSLGSARKRATYNSFKTTANSINTVAVMCVNSGKSLNTSPTLGTTLVCAGEKPYPTFPRGCGDAEITVSGPLTGVFEATCITGECSATCTQEKCTYTGC